MYDFNQELTPSQLQEYLDEEVFLTELQKQDTLTFTEMVACNPETWQWFLLSLLRSRQDQKRRERSKAKKLKRAWAIHWSEYWGVYVVLGVLLGFSVILTYGVALSNQYERQPEHLVEKTHVYNCVFVDGENFFCNGAHLGQYVQEGTRPTIQDFAAMDELEQTAVIQELKRVTNPD